MLACKLKHQLTQTHGKISQKHKLCFFHYMQKTSAKHRIVTKLLRGVSEQSHHVLEMQSEQFHWTCAASEAQRIHSDQDKPEATYICPHNCNNVNNNSKRILACKGHCNWFSQTVFYCHVDMLPWKQISITYSYDWHTILTRSLNMTQSRDVALRVDYL